MNKAEIIKIMQQSATEHIDWVRQGRMLLKGFPEDQIKKPSECEGDNFGHWYFGEGHKLVNIPQLEKLNTLHQEISKTYTALYFMTFDRRLKARSTLITADDIEVPVVEIKFREKKLKDLEDTIKKMLLGLKQVENKVIEMEDINFDSVWFA